MSHFKVLTIIFCLFMLCLCSVLAVDISSLYPEYTDYDAVILESKATFDHTFTTEMSKESISMKILFLTPKGIKDFGFHSTEFNHSNENIGSIKGTVTLPDGKIIKITKSDIMKKKVVKRGQQKRTEVKIAFPSLEPGAIAELSYHLTFNGSRGLSTWPFQSELFTVYSEVSFIPWPGRVWSCSVHRGKTDPAMSETRPGGNSCFTFIRENIPPLPKETHSIAYSGLRETITFYYHDMNSPYDNFWKDGLAEVYKAYFNTMVKPCSKAKKIARTLSKNLKPDEDIIVKLHNYATSHFLPVSMLTRDEANALEKNVIKKIYKSDKNSDLFKQKYVTNWQSAYVLASLIQAARKKAKVELVFCIPWDEGLFDSQLKSVKQFTDIIVKVTYNDKIYWLDPSKRYMPANQIDWGYKGVHVVSVNSETAQIKKIPLDKPEDNKSSVTVNVTFDTENGTANFKKTSVYDHYSSFNWRVITNYYSTDEQRKEYLENLLKNKFGDETILNSFSITNLDDLSEPLTIQLDYTTPYEFEELGDQILMDFPGFLSPSVNPFLTPKRYSRIAFKYPYHAKQEVTYTIPEEYNIVSAPENLTTKSSLYKYSVTYSKISETKFKVSSDVILKGNMIRKGAVNSLRSAYDKVLELQRHKLVLSEE